MTSATSYSVVLTGDCLLNTRVSTCRADEVLAMIDVLRRADVTHTHLEVPLVDPADPAAIPAAEGALAWMWAPLATVDELRWCGVDVVSTASNHALDFSYGGLFSTLRALDGARIAHAGTGADLGAARSPAFVDSAHGRVALVSAVSSHPRWARAGAARVDAVGRPGVNPLGVHHAVPPSVATDIAALGRRLGWTVTRLDGELLVNPPGLYNTYDRYLVTDGLDEVTTVCDDVDLAGNIASIEYAHMVADFVVAHLHTHQWLASASDMALSPAFVSEYARAAVSAGAGAIIVQGSHAPMRGIEVIDGAPVIYDPGPLFRQGRRTAQPEDFHARWRPHRGPADSGSDLVASFGARERFFTGEGLRDHAILSPERGISHEPGFVVPVLTVDSTSHKVSDVTLHPGVWASGPRARSGLPTLAQGRVADDVLGDIARLSEPYRTAIAIEDGVGRIVIA